MKRKKRPSKNLLKENNFVASARCDIRDIATIASYYIEHIETPTSRSELISSAILHLAEILVAKHDAKKFNSNQKAWNYMKSHGLSGKNQTAALKKAIEREISGRTMNISEKKVKSIVEEIANKHV